MLPFFIGASSHENFLDCDAPIKPEIVLSLLAVSKNLQTLKSDMVAVADTLADTLFVLVNSISILSFVEL